MIEPAVSCTCNVLKASLESKVKRVVFVSSASAVVMNPTWPKDQVMDENCWSDKEYCRATKVSNPNMHLYVELVVLSQYIFTR